MKQELRVILQRSLSDYSVKKIIQCLSVDIPVSKTAPLLDKNRNTINRWYGLFRQAIYRYQTAHYFGTKRHRGYHEKLKRGRGTFKQPVFGVFERDGRYTRR